MHSHGSGTRQSTVTNLENNRKTKRKEVRFGKKTTSGSSLKLNLKKERIPRYLQEKQAQQIWKERLVSRIKDAFILSIVLFVFGLFLYWGYLIF